MKVKHTWIENEIDDWGYYKSYYFNQHNCLTIFLPYDIESELDKYIKVIFSNNWDDYDSEKCIAYGCVYYNPTNESKIY